MMTGTSECEEFPSRDPARLLTEPQIQYDQAGVGPRNGDSVRFGFRRRLRRHIVIFQVSGHHLPQRGIVIDDNDMPASASMK